jgi:hypothetical protein
MPIIGDEILQGLMAVPFKALKVKKIAISSGFLLLGAIIYSIISKVAHFIDYKELPGQLIPDFILPRSISSGIIFYSGLTIMILILMEGMIAVGAFDFEEMRGNRFFPIGGALKFARSRIRQLLLSEGAIVAFLAFIILLGVIIGLLVRIPFLGELLYAVFFVFPNFVVAILSTIVIFVLVLSVIVMPAAIAGDRSGEAFNSIQETFSTILRRPIHWILFTAYSVLWAKIGGFVFAYFAFRAVQFIKFSTGIGGGGKIASLIGSGMNHLPLGSPLLYHTTHLTPGLRFGFDLNSLVGAGDIGWAGYLMAISLFVIFVLIWGYIFSIVATGQAYIYAYIRRNRGMSEFS